MIEILIIIFVTSVSFGVGYVHGRREGIRETEVRWSEAVTRADAVRLAKTF